MKWTQENIKTLLECETEDELKKKFPGASIAHLERQQRRFRAEPKKNKEAEAVKEKKEMQVKLKETEQRVKELMKRDKIHIQDFYGQTFKFGVVSDTHFGSIHEKKPELYAAYQYFHKEGVKVVYHCGDLVEGEKLYRGQEYERYVSGADALAQNVIDEYPRNGITTYFVTGSHDLSYWKEVGFDIGNRIAEKRPDMIYLGPDEADIRITPNFIIRLVHPGGGTAYALSYQPQKYIEALSGGQKPTVILFGHYHKAEYMPCYRNIFTIQAGCFQGQTTFMKRKRLAAHLGFWVVEAMINKEKLVSRLKAEFIAFYEKTEINEPSEPFQPLET